MEEAASADPAIAQDNAEKNKEDSHPDTSPQEVPTPQNDNIIFEQSHTIPILVSSANSTKTITTPSASTISADQVSSPPLSEQRIGTSPSSVGRSITSALAAAMKVPSFQGTFLRSSTPPEHDVKRPLADGAQHAQGAERSAEAVQKGQGAPSSNASSPQTTSNKPPDKPSDTSPYAVAPSSQPAPSITPLSASTSYLPSPASFTSFFSPSPRPKSPPQAASALPPTKLPSLAAASDNAPPVSNASKEASEKEKTSLPSGASSSGGGTKTEASPVNAVGSNVDMMPVSHEKVVSAEAPPPAPRPTSSLTALMNAAVPFLTPSSSKPSKEAVSKTGVLTEKQPLLSDSKEGRAAESAAEDGVTSAGGASGGEESSSADQFSSGAPTESDVIPTSSPPSMSDKAPSVAWEEQPGGFPEDNPPGTSPQVGPSSSSPQGIPPGTLPQVSKPIAPSQGIPPSTSPKVSLPITPPLGTIPGTSPELSQPASSARGIPPATPSQGPPPAGSTQGTSPGSSYLSLPSFLPSWSTITAQLPSMPSAPSASKETDTAPTAKAPSSVPSVAPSSGVVSESGPETAPKPESLAQPAAKSKSPLEGRPILSLSETSKPSGSSAIRTENPPNPSPSSLSSTSGSSGQPAGSPETGGKEQAAPRRELDPPAAAAADEIAAGLAGVFGPVTREADKQVEAALRSQEKLALSIDRLTKGLDKLLEESPQPLVAQQAARLAHIRKRVQSLASTLKVVQGRIDSMNWALDRKSSVRTAFTRPRSVTAPNSPLSYQPGPQPFRQSQRHIVGNQADRSERGYPQLPASWRPNPVGNTGVVAPGGGAFSSSRGGEMADLSRVLHSTPSSRSPDKGHRRAMSHDVRFSSALTKEK